MLLDNENMFSDDQAVTGSAVNATNDIDLGAAGVGVNSDAKILAQVTAAFAGGTSIEVQLQTDSDPAFGSAVTLQTTGAIPLADLVQGYEFNLDALPNGCKRYLRLRYVPVGTHTAGTITAGLVFDKQRGL